MSDNMFEVRDERGALLGHLRGRIDLHLRRSIIVPVPDESAADLCSQLELNVRQYMASDGTVRLILCCSREHCQALQRVKVFLPVIDGVTGI